tara:strand:+ start:623 stop:1384 length:762 start_codon:yes stop_codon:yes gene_type:complete
MTLPEILAAARAGQATGFSESFTDLTGIAADEKRDIFDARQNIKDQQEDAQYETAEQERKRGRGRLIGKILGALAGAALAPVTGGLSIKAGTALGAGLGSFAGQKAAGDLSLDNISSGLGEGMFFGNARKNISGAVEDVNRFLGEAEQTFKEKQLASALGDAVTGYSAGNLLEGFFNPSTNLKDMASILNPPKEIDKLEAIKNRLRLPMQNVVPTSYERGMQLLELEDRFPIGTVMNSRRGSFLMGSGYNPFG